jgi:2,4-dienoyl-CoA reductase-like NADH-dependent reductase (Old Yellow Enzyme family)
MEQQPENTRRNFLRQSALIGGGLLLAGAWPSFAAGHDSDPRHARLFQPFRFKQGLKLRNRVVMAPMTTWASNDDYTVSDEEVAYYRRRVQGVGLVITGCTPVAPSGIGFTHQFAGYDDSLIPSLRKLATAAKSGGAPAILQIFHAGNKALAALIPQGDIVSASDSQVAATAFIPAAACRALREAEIQALIKAFGDTTRRAIEAGFDGVELHGAHGFLLQNFLSPLTNQRTDQWGGSLENRLRFPLAVVAEVQRVIKAHATRPFLFGYRVTAEEHEPGGLRLDETYVLLDRLVRAKVDYLHLSLEHLLADKPAGNPTGKTIVELVLNRVAGKVPVLAAGGIRQPDEAVQALALGLSLVAVAHGLVMNPDWVELVQAGKSAQLQTALRKSTLQANAVPPKLWAFIEGAKGWFDVVE